MPEDRRKQIIKTKHQLSVTEIHSPVVSLVKKMAYVHLDECELISKRQHGFSSNRLQQIMPNSAFDIVIR